LRRARRIGADDADAVGMHVGEALSETLQAGDGPVRDDLVEAAVLAHAVRESHHFAQPVDDDELPVHVTGDDHVKAVGAEIDRREDGRHRICAAAHAANEEPQPQVVVAFGLRITNCAPSSPSR
jgi:hypothetical protein